MTTLYRNPCLGTSLLKKPISEIHFSNLEASVDLGTKRIREELD